MSKSAIFSTYFKDLAAVAQQGDAREESFYPALGEIAGRDSQSDRQGRTYTSPRFPGPPMAETRISASGTARTASSVTLRPRNRRKERLDLIEDSEQLKRYRSTFPNLILTNFLEFRLYRNGEREQTVLAARPLVLNRLRTDADC